MKMIKKLKKNDEIAFKAVGYILVILCTLFVILPFWILIVGSFTPEKIVQTKGLTLWPDTFCIDAYKLIFKSPEKILNGYKISIFITVVGTAISLFVTAMTAYALNRKDFLIRNKVAFFIYFTTLFSAGMVPSYLLITQYLHMKNTIWALLIPGMISPFNVIMMRNFVKGIPDTLAEAAKVDGACDFQTFFKIYLPLMKSGLACIGLMIALAYWNNWNNAMLYVDDESLYPLQYLLYQLNSSANYAANAVSGADIPSVDLPTTTLKLAMTIVTIGPIAIVYPFVQKHFIKGITVGAVKG